MKSKTQPTGKVMPNAVELEKAVLGALVIESRAIYRVEHLLRPEMFYNEAYALIFETMLSMNDQRKPIDMLTLTQELAKTGKLQEVGGPFTVSSLADGIASSVNIEFHAKIIAQKYVARQLIIGCSEAIERAYDETEDIEDVLSFVANVVDSTAENTVGSGEAVHISDALNKAAIDMSRRIKLAESGATTGVPTGLRELDKATGGWQNNNLVIIAARPAMGKTALALHFAKQAAKAGVPVCMFSLEMSDISLANRLLLSECDVDAENFRLGRLSSEDILKLQQADYYLRQLPIYVDSNPVVSIRYVKTKARIMKNRGKCGLVIVDYLQLADMEGERGRNREQEVAKASRMAKITAKELDIPFLLLSQLSRKSEDRADKRPQLSDLRESGAIEQDADVVMFVHRPEYYGITEANGVNIRGCGVLIIGKNRDGATLDVKFRYNKSLTRIVNYDSERFPF